jgi:hypothetical protein
MKSKLEDSILDTSGFMKEAGALLIANAGKLIALAVIMITAALTFTDVSFAAFSLKESLPSLLLLTVSSYVVYFSLEDAGERLGESTEEFTGAKKRYDALRKQVTGNDVEALRGFLDDYSERELLSRRAGLLLYLGISEAELEEDQSNGRVKKARRRIARMKPVFLTPRSLLCNERSGRRSELESPERRKLTSLILRLIPSTLCMALTVSVILTAKDGLDSADVLNGILKLSALPIIGFKGYSQGYTFSKHRESAWLHTKSGIIESFLSSTKSNAPTLDITEKV